MEEEQERAEIAREASMQMSSMPFRFYCPTGETREYIIVDNEPDFFRFEHNLKNPRSGKWDIFCACINEHANCPIDAASERPAYYAMYLTIIDLTPYTAASGEEVEWSKKLLVVKPQQQKKFTRFFEREGTLRGMLIAATRDGDKDAAIGNDQEFIEFVTEDELLSYETEYTDKKDKVHTVIGHEPFDYDELFPMPTEAQLRALVGGHAEPGSRESNERAVGRRGAPSRRGGAGTGDDWEKPAVSRSRRGRAEEPEAEGAEEDDAPTSRAGRVTRTASAARPTRTALRRGAPREAEPEDAAEEGDDPPQRRTATASLAEKRRALRR